MVADTPDRSGSSVRPGPGWRWRTTSRSPLAPRPPWPRRAPRPPAHPFGIGRPRLLAESLDDHARADGEPGAGQQPGDVGGYRAAVIRTCSAPAAARPAGPGVPCRALRTRRPGSAPDPRALPEQRRNWLAAAPARARGPAVAGVPRQQAADEPARVRPGARARAGQRRRWRLAQPATSRLRASPPSVTARHRAPPSAGRLDRGPVGGRRRRAGTEAASRATPTTAWSPPSALRPGSRPRHSPASGGAPARAGCTSGRGRRRRRLHSHAAPVPRPGD